MNNSGVQTSEAAQNQQMMNAAQMARQQGFGGLNPNVMPGAGYGMNPNMMPNMMPGVNPNMMPGMNPNMAPQAGANWNMMPQVGVNPNAMPQAGINPNMMPQAGMSPNMVMGAIDPSRMTFNSERPGPVMSSGAEMGTTSMMGGQAEAFNGSIMSTESEPGTGADIINFEERRAQSNESAEADVINLEEVRAQRNMEAAQAMEGEKSKGYESEAVAEKRRKEAEVKDKEAKELEKIPEAKEVFAIEVKPDAEKAPVVYLDTFGDAIHKHRDNPHELCNLVSVVGWDYKEKAFGRRLGDGLNAEKHYKVVDFKSRLKIAAPGKGKKAA